MLCCRRKDMAVDKVVIKKDNDYGGDHDEIQHTKTQQGVRKEKESRFRGGKDEGKLEW